MPQLKWSLSALKDVARLHRFLARENKPAAQRAVAAIRQGVRALEQHPEIGRTLEDFPPEFREWIVEFGQSAYITLYRYDGNEVVILAVRHGREAGY